MTIASKPVLAASRGGHPTLFQQLRAQTEGHKGGNRFFRPSTEEPRKGRVYAAYEVPEPAAEEEQSGSSGSHIETNNGEPVLLECLDTQWVHSLSGAQSWLDRFQDAALSVLELKGYPLPAPPAELEPGEIAWYEFGYEPATGAEADASLYTSLYSAGSPVRITFHEPRPASWSRMGPFGTTASPMTWEVSESLDDAVEAILSEMGANSGVALFDVGQGACQAVMDGARRPSLYVDFGGGVLGNAKTFPTDYIGFCFSNRPAVVLSHWDWDHWSSAYRFPAALQSTWIAPRVPPKPIQLAFAAHLHSLRRLVIWSPKAPFELRVRGVQLERCTGRTANDSGIAVTAYRNPGGRKSCLLPGDADYRHVPSVSRGTTFNSISMSHHGGRLHSKVIPTPKRRGASCVCSVGAGNSYKHPFLDTYEAHLAAGWPLPLTTGFTGRRPSHVFLPWDGVPRVFVGRCHAEAARCNVAI